jgi:hypothetical protein
MSELGHSRSGWPAASPGVVRYAAESGSELFCGAKQERNTMAETVTNDRPPIAERAPRRRSRMAETVSASSLALHLDCSRTYVQKLEAEGVIQRQGGGFALDQSRVAYLRYFWRERRQSPRSEADAEHAKAKAALLRLRIAEKQRELAPGRISMRSSTASPGSFSRI